MTAYGVILFYTTSSAMRTEKALLKAGFTVKLIPTPREFSSDCGIALRFLWDTMERVRGVVEESRLEIAGLHRM